MERGAEIKRDQRIQSNWSRIDKSRYCRDYKEWKLKTGRERYLGDRRVSSETKEQWARLRCGNVGREKCKGFKENECRICGEGEENMQHMWLCKKAREGMNKKWIEVIEKLGLTEEGEAYRRNIVKMLNGEIVEDACEYSREFEKRAKKRQREG